MNAILAENESKGIPKADLTFILFTAVEVIMDRLSLRNRSDLNEQNPARIKRDQQKYLHLAEHREECIAFDTDGNPPDLAKVAYKLISANNAL